MSGTVLNTIDFYGYLESQICRIERFQTKEKLTLVFIKAEKHILATLRPTLEINLRKSDIIFEDKDHIFLALSNTDKDGALHIDEMLKDFLDDDLVYAFATYPEDGLSEEELFVSISQICDEEFGLDFFNYLR